MASPINSLDWWNSYFETQWEQNQGREQTRHFMSQLVQYLPSREHRWISSRSRTILDWGCALGDGVDVLQAEFPACDISGLDFSRVAVKKAQAAYPQYRFLLAEDGAIPSDYDVIVTSNCLEHYSDPFELAARHVRHARYLYIAMLPFEEPAPIDETHVQVFTLRSFPDNIGTFRKLSITVFRPLPRYWNAPQAVACYASAGYPN
jgi:trans-aconitate methyltransferase